MPALAALWALVRGSAAFRWAMAAGVFALAILAALRRAEKRGADKAVRKAREKDHAHADNIRERADDVRRRLDGADGDWLRDHAGNRDRN